MFGFTAFKDNITVRIWKWFRDLSFVDFSYACLKNVFSSRADIHRAKLRIIKWNPWFVLRNNANIVMTPFLLSKDNIDLQFATKHLGQFLLTRLLLDNMKKTARESKKEGRIVNVSSEAHMLTYPEGILFDKI